MTEQDMVHKLEKKFDFLESIYFERINERGQHVFSCVDAGKEVLPVCRCRGLGN
jgi:hypothetical protein